MLTASPGVGRSGATLAELLVALSLTGIVLGAAASSLLRQQRTAAVLGASAAGAAQMRAAFGALAVELAPLAAGSGDVVPGEATDTSLQVRTVVASAVACDEAAGRATFAGDGVSRPSEAVAALLPRAGDSLWWHAGAANGGWQGDVIVASDSVPAPCALDGAGLRARRRVTIGSRDTIRSGMHLRVTRPARYVFYRSGDGSWQLGLREWIEERRQLAPPQPFAGPFLRPGAAESAGFRYFDATGVELEPGERGVEAHRVARVRVSVVIPDRPGAATSARVVRDSIDVALQPRAAP